ncbi:MAG: CvpA family protein [Clostridia bacterium]|nr:CvpA family protein [Clostridia bacterium]MDD4572528.1 CvpA family protein [Clostridia bacterium]
MAADLVLAVIILMGIFWGFKAGILKALAGIGSFIGGIIIARRITPLVLPWLEQKFGWNIAEASGEGFWQSWFFSQSGTGRVIEIILFVIVVGLTIWVLRFILNFLGNIFNMTPILGFFSRLLGAAAGLIITAFLLYVAIFMLLPWLDHTFIEVSLWSALLAWCKGSVYVLPLINEIGAWIWLTAALSIGNLLPTGVKPEPQQF